MFSAPVRSQSTKLIEAGKQEGKAVIYGSLESDTTDAIKQEFQKNQHPGRVLARFGNQSYGSGLSEYP